MDLNSFLINDPSPDALDSLGLYIPSPGHTGWDLEGAHKRGWAMGLGIFDPCKKRQPCSSSRNTMYLHGNSPVKK